MAEGAAKVIPQTQTDKSLFCSLTQQVRGKSVYVCVREKCGCRLRYLHSSNETLRYWLSGKRQTDAWRYTTHPPYFKGVADLPVEATCCV